MNRDMIISYLNLRKLIGILGITLPFMCLFGGIIFSGLPIGESISYYYYTNMRDLFTGVLIGVGFFLITYKGYDKADDLITTVAGVLGMLIAIFPMVNTLMPKELVGVFHIPSFVSNYFHLFSAGSYFIVLAYMSFFQFTKSPTNTPKAKLRDKIYKTCGIIMLGGIILLLIQSLFDVFTLSYFVWLIETIMLIAFGTSWLVKGRAIFND